MVSDETSLPHQLSVLSWLFKHIKNMSPKVQFQGLLKCPNHRTAILNFSKVGRLALWADIFIFELQFAETQVFLHFTLPFFPLYAQKNPAMFLN